VPADHNATRTGVLWATSCTNTVSDLVLRHDGSPLVRCGSAYTLYPTAGVVDIYGKKPSIALHAYADKIREANGGTMLVATGTNTVALFTYDGAPVASMAPSNDVASDGFRGPEFGLKPTAGETGALVQTPSGVALYDYSSHALAWTQARFFLPLAVGTSGFVGVCSRPPVANGAPLDDHLELCLLRETGETAWQVAVPWQNYGVAARKLDGSASIFQASGHYVEAAAAHRWIVSNTQGTFAIATP
jgi:hypothetical protein